MGMAAKVDQSVTARSVSDVKTSHEDCSEPVLCNSGATNAPFGNATIFNQPTGTGPTISIMRELLQLEFAPEPLRELSTDVLESEPAPVVLSDQTPFAGKQFWKLARTALSEWRNRARLRREVASLSDRELWDVSLTRADAMNETHKPFWKP